MTLDIDLDAARLTRVSVVICSYDDARWDLLQEAVAEARRQLAATDELVVVCDHNPQLAERLRTAWPEDVIITENRHQPGLSGARTSGVELAHGDAIVFLDDDAVPRPGWLEAMRRHFDDADVLGVSGRALPRWEGGSRPRWFPDEFGWVVGCDYRGLPGHGETVRNPIGANMAFRADVLKQVGSFADGLGRIGATPRGCEETEIAIRIARTQNGKIVRDAEATVDHFVPRHRSTPAYFLSRSWHEGRSKAALTALMGQRDSLSSERRHLLRTLPAGVLRARPTRSAAIIAGTAATGLGFVTALRRTKASEPAEQNAFTPIPMADLDLDDTSTDELPAPNASGELVVLAFHRGWPIGLTHLDSLETGTDIRQRVVAALPDGAAAPASWPASWQTSRRLGTITVVVATLGLRPQLVDVVQAILQQSYHDLEVLVVDNDPVARRAHTLLADIDDRRLSVLYSHLRGTSAARNVGLRHASGAVIAFTDDDAVPDPTWIEHLVSGFELARPYGESRLSAITGLAVAHSLNTPSQLHFESAAGFSRGFTAQFWSARSTLNPLPGLAERGPEGAAFPYTGGEFGSGNNMAFRTETLRRLGGFDENLGPGTPARGAEDLDVLRRFYLGGETIAYVPHAIVRHHHRDDDDALVEQMAGYGIGMGASLTKLVLSSPIHAARLALRMPTSLRILLSPGSVKNADKTADFPKAATRAELRGYLTGPWHYLVSRLRPWGRR